MNIAWNPAAASTPAYNGTSSVRVPQVVTSSPQESFAPSSPASGNSLIQPSLAARAVQTAAEPTAAKNRTWSDELFYFPLTDRFNDGDKSNNIGLRPDYPIGFHGGDLQGIIDKLDYIKDLGATTLWLAPIQKNTYELQFGDYHGHGFHGYWINDHEKVEPRQGDIAKAQELVKKAHAKGFKVVLDTVLNHTGPDHPWVKDPSKKDWFNQFGDISDYDNQYQVENGRLGGLPDLNQSNPETYRYLLDNTEYWVKTLGVDGVRLDAVKHIPKDFWNKFVPDLKSRVDDPEFFVLGEVLHGDPNYVAEYQKAGIDYIFDIPLYYTIRDVFGNDSSARKLGERLAEDSKYPEPDKLVTLLDNHDFPRFMSTAQGDFDTRVQRLKLATAFLNCVRGIPSVYYGTEVAMEGGGDPDNRRDMDFGRCPEVRQHFTQLAHIRQSSEALRRGEQLEMWQDDQVYAFARRTESEEAVCVFNTSGSSQSRSIPLRPGSPLQEGDVLVNQLDGREYKVGAEGVTLELPARSPAILTKKA